MLYKSNLVGLVESEDETCQTLASSTHAQLCPSPSENQVRVDKPIQYH
jgi:hypothetical protein